MNKKITFIILGILCFTMPYAFSREGHGGSGGSRGGHGGGHHGEGHGHRNEHRGHGGHHGDFDGGYYYDGYYGPYYDGYYDDEDWIAPVLATEAIIGTAEAAREAAERD